jgi:hypothetical protein
LALTTPDEIWTPDTGDDYALTTDLAATADTIQDAINGLRTEFRGFAQAARNTVGGQSLTPSQMTTVVSMTLPNAAPAGTYLVHISTVTGSSGTAQHYQRVAWGGTEITNTSNDFILAAPGETAKSDTLIKTDHLGGAATLTLGVQVNGAGASCRLARMTVEYVGPTA